MVFSLSANNLFAADVETHDGFFFRFHYGAGVLNYVQKDVNGSDLEVTGAHVELPVTPNAC